MQHLTSAYIWPVRTFDQRVYLTSTFDQRVHLTSANIWPARTFDQHVHLTSTFDQRVHLTGHISARKEGAPPQSLSPSLEEFDFFLALFFRWIRLEWPGGLTTISGCLTNIFWNAVWALFSGMLFGHYFLECCLTAIFWTAFDHYGCLAAVCTSMRCTLMVQQRHMVKHWSIVGWSRMPILTSARRGFSWGRCPLSNISPSFDQHLTNIWPTFDQHLNNIWPTFDQHLTIVWPSFDHRPIILQSTIGPSFYNHSPLLWPLLTANRANRLPLFERVSGPLRIDSLWATPSGPETRSRDHFERVSGPLLQPVHHFTIIRQFIDH